MVPWPFHPVSERAFSPLALQLLYPTLALVLLTFMVLGLLGFLRLRAITARKYPRGYFKLMKVPEGAELPRRTEAVSRNLINLFETPVLFYALVPLAVVFGVYDAVSIGLLWTFVAFRYLHTAIHVTSNKIPLRFSAYAVASAALVGAWVHFAVMVLSRG
jgi:hypothetical protein